MCIDNNYDLFILKIKNNIAYRESILNDYKKLRLEIKVCVDNNYDLFILFYLVM